MHVFWRSWLPPILWAWLALIAGMCDALIIVSMAWYWLGFPPVKTPRLLRKGRHRG